MLIQTIFKRMNVTDLKKFLLERRVSGYGYDKRSLVKIASASKRMDIPCIPQVKHPTSTEKNDRLCIHEQEIKKINDHLK